MSLKNFYKLVTFDITGTILQLRHPVGEIYANIGKQLSLHADPGLLNKNFKKVWVEMNDTHPNFGLCTGIGWEKWWNKFVLLTFEGVCSHQDNKSKSVMGEVAEELIKIFKSAEGWKLTEGSKDLLELLKRRNVIIGVVSNFDPRLHEILHSLDIHYYFEFVCTSYECGYLKPDRKIFQCAEKMFENNTKKKFVGTHSLHVGDSFDIDFIGALEAGWNAALVSNKPLLSHNFDTKRGNVFTSIEDLITFFE